MKVPWWKLWLIYVKVKQNKRKTKKEFKEQSLSMYNSSPSYLSLYISSYPFAHWILSKKTMLSWLRKKKHTHDDLPAVKLEFIGPPQSLKRNSLSKEKARQSSSVRLLIFIWQNASKKKKKRWEKTEHRKGWRFHRAAKKKKRIKKHWIREMKKKKQSSKKKKREGKKRARKLCMWFVSVPFHSYLSAFLHLCY